MVIKPIDSQGYYITAETLMQGYMFEILNKLILLCTVMHACALINCQVTNYNGILKQLLIGNLTIPLV